MAIEARNRPLPDWFTWIRTGQLVLPRFQRFEAWDHSNVAQLFNTILRGLPVGSVLVLEVGKPGPFVCRAIEGAPIAGDWATEHLLDGQQRLTALWRGLHNNYDDRTYFLNMEEDEDTGMPYFVGSIARSMRPGDTKPRPFWANTPEGQWNHRKIPLQLLRPDIESQPKFRKWAIEAKIESEERERLSDQLSEIRQLFHSFNLPFLSLPSTTKKETALDVFLKMNTSASELKPYDIVVAQIEAGMGTSLHDLISDVKRVCPAITAYYPPEDLVLYSTALLEGKPPTNATYLNKDFGTRIVGNWEKFLTGVSRTVAFLQDERIFDSKRLPSDVTVPVLVALWSEAPESGDAAGRARTTLRKYMWRAFFSSRYERSTNSRALADFNDLKAVLCSKEAPTPVIFDEEQHPLPAVEELLSAGWPDKKERVAKAILALALREGGLDLADGSTVTRENLMRREYHHLFPAAHLSRINVGDKDIYLSLNCALVTWQTNRTISDKEPERYLAERRDGTNLGDTEIRYRLASHLIPYDEMVAGDYRAFLTARAELIHEKMKSVCEGAVA